MKKERPPIKHQQCQDRGWGTATISEGKVDVWFCDCEAYEKLSKMLERCKNK